MYLPQQGSHCITELNLIKSIPRTVKDFCFTFRLCTSHFAEQCYSAAQSDHNHVEAPFRSQRYALARYTAREWQIRRARLAFESSESQDVESLRYFGH